MACDSNAPGMMKKERKKKEKQNKTGTNEFYSPKVKYRI